MYRPPLDSELWFEVEPYPLEEAPTLEALFAPEIRYYSDVDAIYDTEYHALIFGVPRSGKTNLLLRIEKAFWDRGWLVIHRDDMDSFNWLKMLDVLPKAVIWVPKGCKAEIRGLPKAEIKVRPYDPDNLYHDVIEALGRAYRRAWRYHVILFDSFLGPSYETVGKIARFYTDFLLGLVAWASQRPKRKKIPIMIGFDEINDLIPPRGKHLSEAHEALREVLVLVLRKVGKHKIKIFGTSHRVTQVAPDIRAMAHLMFFKTTPIHDAYDFLNKLLVWVDNETFFSILKRLRYLDPEIAFYVDYRGNYDFVKFSFLPEPSCELELKGTIAEPTRRKIFDEKDMAIMVMRLKGLSFREIAEHVGLSFNAVWQRWHKIKDNSRIAQALAGAGLPPLDKMYQEARKMLKKASSASS